MDIHITPAEIKDIDQLALLKQPAHAEHRAHNEQLAWERIEKAREGSVVFLVIKKQTTLLGQVLFSLNGTTTQPRFPNLQDLYILEKERGKGLGRRLIQRCEQIAREKGYTQVSVSVNPTLNPRAKALYERLGYRVSGSEPYLDGVYHGDEDWVIDLVKDLE